MRSLRVGFIGFGEAAQTLSDHLWRHGVTEIKAFCSGSRNRPPYTEDFIEKAKQRGASLVGSLSELVETSDLLVSAVIPQAAVTVGRDVARYMRPGQLYVDVNAAPPSAKRAVASFVEGRGALFVDASIMGAVSLYGGSVPIYVSGSGAREFVQYASATRLNVTMVGAEAGTASTLKVLRSVVTKGMEALLVEALLAAQLAGVVDAAFKAITEPMDSIKYSDFAKMCITTDAVHAYRRAAEMQGAVQVIQELGVEPIMTEATYKRLSWSARLDLRRIFGDVPPDDYHSVLDLYERLSQGSRQPNASPSEALKAAKGK